MKFRKSILSGFIIVVLFISVISPTFALASDNVDYSGAFSRMKQLEVLDSSISDVTKNMTRGEFVKAVAVAANLTDEASAMERFTLFPDVSVNSKLSGYINILLDKGLISGMADGKFHPEAGITYSEICTVLVRLLGYTDGDLTGTWPLNYLNKASSLKLTSNLTLKKNDKVSLRDAAIIFDRLLDTKIKSDDTNSTDETIFSDSVNLYSDCSIYDNSQSSSNLASNEVLTDKGTLYMEDNNIKLEAGQNYRIKIEDGEITKVYGKVKETETITVNNIVGNSVYYNEDGKEKSMTLPSSIKYYYHGEDKAYESVTKLLIINMSLTFSYNDTKTAYSYAVITDPIYSKPQLASNFNPKSNKLGDITFDSNTKIMKNGKIITKNDINDRDVIYGVTDIKGENKYILVIENYIEGNITAFLADGFSSNGIQIDTASYNYSKDIDITKLASFSKGDLVTIILGYDDKIVDIRSIDEKTGSIGEYIILGNYKTSDDLADHEVLTDKGTFTYTSEVESLQIGAKYQLYVNDNVITKIDKKQNSTENYVVTDKAALDMKWENEKDETSTMKLPKASVYYYHGEKVNYAAAVAAINTFSSIILCKSSNNKDYEYAVIIDPYFADPKVYRYSDVKLRNQIENSKYLYIYRNEMYTVNPDSINEYDVVYFVSDIWGKNCYIYAYNQIVNGFIQSFTPSKINATSVKVNNQTYEFSPYFDKTKFTSYYSGHFVKLIMGVDGKIVDVYQ